MLAMIHFSKTIRSFIRGFLAFVGYMLRFLHAIGKRQDIRLPEGDLKTHGSYYLTRSYKKKWDLLYNRAPSSREVPFDYQTAVGAKVMFTFLSRIGVNFKNILYLKHEMALGSAGELAADTRYTLSFAFDKILEVRDDRVVLVICIEATPQGCREPASRSREYFLVKNVDGKSMDRIRRSAFYSREKTDTLQNLSKTRSKIVGQNLWHRPVPLYYAENAGLRFGMLSGDLNFLHISPLFAKLCGFSEPFAQGLYSSNYILSALSELHRESITAIEITFHRTVGLGQTVDLLVADDCFELVDAQQNVLCTGTYKKARDRSATTTAA